MPEILYELFAVAIYSVLGIVLMLVGNFLIDLIVPCHFPTEIKRGNKAVGWLSAGSFIGIAVILRDSIMSDTVQAAEKNLTEGLIGSTVYFVAGVIFFMLGYIIVNVFNKKYDLNDEIGKGNTAAGIMVFGIFVGLAIVIGGVIH